MLEDDACGPQVLMGAALAVGVSQRLRRRPIRHSRSTSVVPFPPGGGTDALARAIQEPFQKAIGQTVIIDNRGGGGGSIGHEIVAKAAARRLHRAGSAATTRCCCPT